MDRKYVVLPSRPAGLPFSDAVLAGDALFLSGRIGLDPKTGRPPAAASDEARLMLDGVRNVLSACAMSMDDLVYVQVFCSDVSLFGEFNAIYRPYFGSDLPARAFLGSGPLLFGARFEIQGIAIRRHSRRSPRRRRRRAR